MRPIDSVEFSCTQQRLDGSGPLTGPLGTGKQPVLFAQGNERMVFSTGLLSMGK